MPKYIWPISLLKSTMIIIINFAHIVFRRSCVYVTDHTATAPGCCNLQASAPCYLLPGSCYNFTKSNCCCNHTHNSSWLLQPADLNSMLSDAWILLTTPQNIPAAVATPHTTAPGCYILQTSATCYPLPGSCYNFTKYNCCCCNPTHNSSWLLQPADLSNP